MSILIKGLDIPREDDCLPLNIYKDGRVAINLNAYAATAEQLPPHGRLIDADALKKTIRPITEEDDFGACTFRTVKELMKNHINNAPTIIEAEEGET